MERPDNNDAFYGPFDNGFALGITAQNWTESERVTWRYGVYPAGDERLRRRPEQVHGRRRGSPALPWYEDDGAAA